MIERMMKNGTEILVLIKLETVGHLDSLLTFDFKMLLKFTYTSIFSSSYKCLSSYQMDCHDMTFMVPRRWTLRILGLPLGLHLHYMAQSEMSQQVQDGLP